MNDNDHCFSVIAPRKLEAESTTAGPTTPTTAATTAGTGTHRPDERKLTIRTHFSPNISTQPVP